MSPLAGPVLTRLTNPFVRGFPITDGSGLAIANTLPGRWMPNCILYPPAATGAGLSHIHPLS
ncbi:hypothetical protein ACM0P6_00745 [Komagataeibacter sucrofermentans]|uniref:hypothetical protein n=1 Tax=Komagataeibacter sucrofermentans TaxID=1053551 RepID=UPI0011B6CCB9|nr:hypothetical protein [Komagataeibacter sucrofermentans]